MKILVVDDHAENRYFIETLFKASDTQVISASNGAEGLEAVRKDRFDLIISDVLMPVMDGFEFCRKVRQDPALAEIPFVFYTATYTDAKDKTFGMSLGAARYLTKPMDSQELYGQLLECAGRPAQKTTPSPAEDDAAFLKQYNSRLVAKLEKKMLDLEAANHALHEELNTRERLEKELRQAHKLEAVGRLAGGIAHDFNNILCGIIGFAELARFELKKPEALLGHLDGIIAASGRARDLVQQILTFSRKRERKRRPLNLPAALEDACKLLRATIPANIELRKSFAPDVPSIFADSTEIHQIATNLVTNAWHAIEPQATGVITLEVAAVKWTENEPRPSNLPPGDYARLSVSDTGCGMTTETLDHIFDPFFSTKAPGKGSGLGLSVVHGIMLACEGAITVESTLGQGTMFHLYFPAHHLPAETEAQPTQSAKTGGGQRILFVDDDETLTSLGERFLNKLGYTVEAETDPEKAIEHYRRTHFDLILTDLTMPGMSGLDLAQKCQSIRPGTPVILMTGFNPTLQQEDLVTQGITEIILKPYGIQALSETVSAALSKTKPTRA